MVSFASSVFGRPSRGRRNSMHGTATTKESTQSAPKEGGQPAADKEKSLLRFRRKTVTCTLLCEPEFREQQHVVHCKKDTNGQWVLRDAIVLKVHREDPSGAYYTILLQSTASEIQTVENYLATPEQAKQLVETKDEYRNPFDDPHLSYVDSPTKYNPFDHLDDDDFQDQVSSYLSGTDSPYSSRSSCFSNGVPSFSSIDPLDDLGNSIAQEISEYLEDQLE